jgi:hypothetical protein
VIEIQVVKLEQHIPCSYGFWEKKAAFKNGLETGYLA